MGTPPSTICSSVARRTASFKRRNVRSSSFRRKSSPRRRSGKRSSQPPPFNFWVCGNTGRERGVRARFLFDRERVTAASVETNLSVSFVVLVARSRTSRNENDWDGCEASPSEWSLGKGRRSTASFWLQGSDRFPLRLCGRHARRAPRGSDRAPNHRPQKLLGHSSSDCDRR